MKRRAALFALAGLLTACRTQPAAERRVEVAPDVAIDVENGPSAEISPDGKQLVLAAGRLYLRGVDGGESTPVAGTEGARDPFFSADGRWIAYFADSRLWKIPVAGGAAVALAAVESPRGGAWTNDAGILFATLRGGLWRIPAEGGAPAAFTTPDINEREVTHRWPQMLPGRGVVLYTAHSDAAGGFEDAHAVMRDLRTGRVKVVHRGGYAYRYASGHLLYLSQGRLFAVPFDIDHLHEDGTPSVIADSVAGRSHHGGGQLSVSDTGTIAFAGERLTGKQAIDWLDRSGETKPLRAAQEHYYGISLSPDGDRMAFGISDGYKSSVSVYDMERGATTALSVTAGSSAPIWTPDGKRVTYVTAQNIFWQNADGTGVAQRLTEGKNIQVPEAWHPSGKYLAFREAVPDQASDIKILPMEGGKPGVPYPLVSGRADELGAAFSPDGAWFCYVSNAVGDYRIYASKFQRDLKPWPVSPGFGTVPVWSKRGQRIFYRGRNGQILSVAYKITGDIFDVSPPESWSDQFALDLGPARSFDLTPDGKRIALMVTSAGKAPAVTVVYNFSAR